MTKLSIIYPFADVDQRLIDFQGEIVGAGWLGAQDEDGDWDGGGNGDDGGGPIESISIIKKSHISPIEILRAVKNKNSEVYLERPVYFDVLPEHLGRGQSPSCLEELGCGAGLMVGGDWVWVLCLVPLRKGPVEPGDDAGFWAWGARECFLN